LIELSEQLRTREVELHLIWIPREENQEADDLTNEMFEKFSPEHRVLVDPLNIPWLVLKDLMNAGSDLYGEIVKLKSQKRSRSNGETGNGKRRKRESLLSAW
jgi:hypothetical protein